MSATENLPDDDFRARRDYLPDDAFALVGTHQPPRDPISEGQWNEFMALPTDVLLRTSDDCGTPIAQLNRLWGLWVQTMPIEVEAAPFMHNVGWDAGDDFQACLFTAVHGFYRQALACLRSALDGLTIAASFAMREDKLGFEQWRRGHGVPPKAGNARDLLQPRLGVDVSAVLKKLYSELSGYIHPQHDTANVVLWGGSNGPVWEPASFIKVYESFREVIAMCFVLLCAGWPGFSIREELWPLFVQPGGAWTEIPIEDLRRRFGSSA